MKSRLSIRKIILIPIWIILCLISFFSFIFFIASVETLLRDRFGEEGKIPIEGLPIPNVKAEASWSTHTFFEGKGWTINIETDKSLNLFLDDWEGVIPPVTHRIFSNIDHTNTGDYGHVDVWYLPKIIELQELDSPLSTN